MPALPREGRSEEQASPRQWKNLDLHATPRCEAWVTGSTVWVECHHINDSRPCRAILTKGKLACMVDHGRYPLKELGYVPLACAGGEDRLVVVQSYSKACVKALKLGQKVIASREKGSARPVILTPALNNTPLPGLSDRLAEPLLFDACLFRMWGDSELGLYFGHRGVRHRPLYQERGVPNLDQGEGRLLSRIGEDVDDVLHALTRRHQVKPRTNGTSNGKPH